MPKKKTIADQVFDLGYSARSAEESTQNLALLKAIHAKRFGVPRASKPKVDFVEHVAVGRA